MTQRPEGSGSVETVAQEIAQGLRSAGWETSDLTWPDRTVTVARTSVFRWQFLGTRLHTFAFVIPAQGGEDFAWLDGMLATTVQHAVANKGGLPRGLQTGVAAVPVVVGAGLDPSLQSWAARSHGRRFAAMTHPVLADIATGTVVQPAHPVIGAVFHSYLVNVTNTFVGPAVRRARG